MPSQPQVKWLEMPVRKQIMPHRANNLPPHASGAPSPSSSSLKISRPFNCRRQELTDEDRARACICAEISQNPLSRRATDVSGSAAPQIPPSSQCNLGAEQYRDHAFGPDFEKLRNLAGKLHHTPANPQHLLPSLAKTDMRSILTTYSNLEDLEPSIKQLLEYARSDLQRVQTLLTTKEDPDQRKSLEDELVVISEYIALYESQAQDIANAKGKLVYRVARLPRILNGLPDVDPELVVKETVKLLDKFSRVVSDPSIVDWASDEQQKTVISAERTVRKLKTDLDAEHGTIETRRPSVPRSGSCHDGPVLRDSKVYSTSINRSVLKEDSHVVWCKSDPKVLREAWWITDSSSTVPSPSAPSLAELAQIVAEK